MGLVLRRSRQNEPKSQKYDCSNRSQVDFLLCKGDGNGLTAESTKRDRDLNRV